jgi:hypothetical protein
MEGTQAFALSANMDVHRDDDGNIRTLRHPQEPFSPEQAGLTEPSPLELADQYVREVAPLYVIEEGQLAGLSEEALGEPSPTPTPSTAPTPSPAPPPWARGGPTYGLGGG